MAKAKKRALATLTRRPITPDAEEKAVADNLNRKACP